MNVEKRGRGTVLFSFSIIVLHSVFYLEPSQATVFCYKIQHPYLTIKAPYAFLIPEYIPLRLYVISDGGESYWGRDVFPDNNLGSNPRSAHDLIQ